MRARGVLFVVAISFGLHFGVSAAEVFKQTDAQAVSATALADGEVRKIDKDAGKVTIKHGPLTNLGMPAMTMVFRVADPAMLDQMKDGDKINFLADKVNGAFIVIRLEPAK